MSGVVSILLNRDCEIHVVHNQTGQRKETTYLVRMRSIQDAKDVRAKFGAYFAGGTDTRPAALKGISISNWTTPGTKVRIAILKVLASRYRASNPGSRVQVIHHSPAFALCFLGFYCILRFFNPRSFDNLIVHVCFKDLLCMLKLMLCPALDRTFWHLATAPRTPDLGFR